MAEGLVNHYLGGQWQAYSAGTAPSGSVHPLAVRSMAELEIDISDSISESVEAYLELNPHLVITVCDNAARSCPVWVGEGNVTHMPFDDPTHVVGSDAKRMAACREVRDQMRDELLGYLRE
jgi:arsenate reductase